jgi:hypothetical protein
MKALVLAATVAATFAAGGLAAATAEAAPFKKSGYHPAHHAKVYKGKVTPAERAAIQHSKYNLNRLRTKVYADGKVTSLERMKLQRAEQKHAALVRRAVR